MAFNATLIVTSRFDLNEEFFFVAQHQLILVRALNGIGETEWLMTLEDKPLAIIGEAQLHDLENLDAVLDAHEKASPLFKGVRDMLAVHPSKAILDFNETGDMLQSEDFKKGYARLGERELSFDATFSIFPC